MKSYEVVREIFNNCAKVWRIDTHFTDEIETDDLVGTMTEWFKGDLPKYEIETLDDGTLLYTFNDVPLPERFYFTEF